MNLEEKRAYAKEELGIAQAMNMKEETLDQRIAEAEQELNPEQPALEIMLTEDDKEFLAKLNFEYEWLASLANQYNFDKFQYMHKFRAFRCFRDGRQLDWIDINDFGLLHRKKELCRIFQKFQPLQKDKQVIKLAWRR